MNTVPACKFFHSSDLVLYCHLLLCVTVYVHSCACVLCVHVCPTEPKRRKVDEKVKIFMKNDITCMCNTY